MALSFLDLLHKTSTNELALFFPDDVIVSLSHGVWPSGTGPQGPQGPPGIPGSGMVWFGAWSGAISYLQGDGVEINGSSYIAIADNLNSSPPSASWDLVAAKGTTGSQGLPGTNGADGAAGAPGPNTVTGTTTSTLTGLLKGTGTLVAVASAPADYVATADSRLSDARTPTAHSHPESDITGLTTDLSNKQPLDTQLTDLAALVYTANALKMVRVNAGATAFELATASAAVAWGAITGTLTDQTDLGTALGLKAPLANPAFSGTVTGITKAMVGLTSADDTADTAKPVSTAQQTALNLKANLAGPTFTGAVTLPAATVTLAQQANMATASLVYRKTAGAGAPEVNTLAQVKTDLALTATDVGLGSVNNTTDAGKPVSTAQQTALDLKANLAGPTLTGVPAAPTAAVDTNTTQIATSAFVVAQASATNPLMDGVVAIGTSLRYARQDHVHASDTSRAPTASPTFTGTVVLPASTSLTTPVIGVATGTSLAATGLIKSSSPSAGIGYAAGAGLAVTQLSSRATGVSINAICGQITGIGTSLAAAGEAVFIVTNPAVALQDVVVLSVQSGPTAATSVFSVSAVTAGTFSIRIRNLSATVADIGVPIINFAIIKAVKA